MFLVPTPNDMVPSAPPRHSRNSASVANTSASGRTINLVVPSTIVLVAVRVLLVPSNLLLVLVR